MDENDQKPLSKQILRQLKWPHIHESIQYINNGLYTSLDLQPYTLLIVAQIQSIISQHSLPNMFNKLHYLQGVNQIALYVLILKNLRIKEVLDPKINLWLKSQSKGFVSFSEKLITHSNDTQLFIQYVAIKNNYFSQAKQIYEDKVVIQILKYYIDIPIFQKFLEMFIIASQFCNTRAFGYTKDYLLIPGLDYLNYDPSKDSNNITFINFQDFQQVKRQFDRIKQQKQEKLQEQYSQSQEEKQESCEGTKRYVGIFNKRRIKSGQQLLLNYGGLENRRLLTQYGFSVKNNPNDFVLIYVSKYQNKRMIFFSQVERSTIKFKIRDQKACVKLIDFFRQIHNPYQEKIHKNKILSELIQQLQSTRPPSVAKQKIKQLQNEPGYTYLLIYQEQQQRIYQNQIRILKQMISGQ